MAQGGKAVEHLAHRSARRVGARRVGIELAPADFLQDRLRQDRPGGIVRADEEDVERWTHDRLLVDVVG